MIDFIYAVYFGVDKGHSRMYLLLCKCDRCSDMNEMTLVKIFLYTDDIRRGAMKDSLAFFLLNDGWNSLFGFGHRLPLLFCALLSSHAPLLPFFTFCFLTGPHILQNAK